MTKHTAETILIRLTKACYPLDMWLGGIWSRPLTEKERHEFVLALSDAYGFVRDAETKP